MKVLFSILMCTFFSVVEVWAQTTIWISKDSDGNEGDRVSLRPSISANGRFVTFMSWSENLVLGDTNGFEDIFVHDNETNATTRVSVDSHGNESNGTSVDPSISGDGRYVTFVSVASNLVEDDTNEQPDVFLHDRMTGETTRVSVNSDGIQADFGNLDPTIAGSSNAAISADGYYVTFQSNAKNLVLNDTNDQTDIFLHNRQTGETTRVSLNSEGYEANSASIDPSISADGRYIAFVSYASNLAPEDYWHADVFVHDRITGVTNQVSLNSDGIQPYNDSWQPSISSDGRYVAFRSSAVNLVPDKTSYFDDVFLKDCETGETSRMSIDSEGNQANYDSSEPSISGNGQVVVFPSKATNLVPEDTNGQQDIFVHNRATGETSRVSVSSDGTESNDTSGNPSISSDGPYVVFNSKATNLVSEDTFSNDWGWEIYMHGPLTDSQLNITVDIAPNRDPNRVKPERGKIAVAIVTDETLDATRVDPESIRFGPEEANVIRKRVVDIDSDGDTDLVYYFQTEETGISCGDSAATLTGETFDGVLVSGTDTIVTIGCR